MYQFTQLHVAMDYCGTWMQRRSVNDDHDSVPVPMCWRILLSPNLFLVQHLFKIKTSFCSIPNRSNCFALSKCETTRFFLCMKQFFPVSIKFSKSVFRRVWYGCALHCLWTVQCVRIPQLVVHTNNDFERQTLKRTHLKTLQKCQ